MAEEPAVCVDGFEAAAVGAEDNLSIPLGDFMAFLNTEPAPPEEGREEDEEELQQPAVSRLSSCPNSLCAGFSMSDRIWQDGAALRLGFWVAGVRIRRIFCGILALGLAILDDLGLIRCCTF